MRILAVTMQMRILAVTMLTIFQFSAFPFIAIVAGNTMRLDAPIVQQASTQNVTTIYKTTAM